MEKPKEAKTFSGFATREFNFIWILRYAQYDEWGVDSHILDCHENPTDFLAMTKNRF